MGMEGPDTLGYLRTLIIAMLVGACAWVPPRVIIDLIKTMARFFIRRWHLHDEVASVHRHGDRRRAGRSP